MYDGIVMKAFFFLNLVFFVTNIIATEIITNATHEVTSLLKQEILNEK